MRAARAGKALAVVAIGGLPFLVHAGLLAGSGTLVAKSIIALQFLILGTIVVLAIASKYRWLAVAGAAAVVAVALLRGSAQLGVLAGAGLTHFVAHCALLALFASTLLPGHEALITALSRKMSGTMTEERARYTRRVTIAWCCYFGGQLLGSLLLLLFAPIVVWSFFINVLNFPLIVLMFVGELVVRRFALPHRPRYTLAEMMQMWPYIRARLSKQAGSD